MVLILPPHCQFKGILKGKVLPRCGRKRALSDSITVSLSPFLLWFALFVCFALFFLSPSSFYTLLCLTCFVCLFFSFVLFCFSNKNKNKIEKSEKYKNSVCLYTLVLVYLGWPLKQSFSKLCIFCSLDEHHYAQLSK